MRARTGARYTGSFVPGEKNLVLARARKTPKQGLREGPVEPELDPEVQKGAVYTPRAEDTILYLERDSLPRQVNTSQFSNRGPSARGWKYEVLAEVIAALA